MSEKRIESSPAVSDEVAEAGVVTVPTRRRNKTRVSDAELVHLREKGLSLSQIGKIAEMTKQAVSSRLKSRGEMLERVEEFKEDEVVINYDLRRRILESISDKNIDEAKLQAKAIVYGILVDKQRLISGESTQNIASWTSIVSQSHKSHKKVAPVETTAEEVAE